MPITVTTTAGTFDRNAERLVLPRLANALLARNGLTGNAFMTPNVVGSLHVLPEGHMYAGGETNAVFVELKVPSFAFTTQEQRQGFVDDVHTVLHDLIGDDYPKDRTFVNITYTVDGSWGMGDRAWTNAELGRAVADAAAIPEAAVS